MSDKIEKENTRPVFTPVFDIVECKDGFTVWADVPGADVGGLEIGVDGDKLTVSAKVDAVGPEGLPLLYREYGSGDYETSFRVSEKIDKENIVAELKNGVLTLTLPKAKESEPRKVRIKAA